MNALRVDVGQDGVALVLYDVPGEPVNTLRDTFQKDFEEMFEKILGAALACAIVFVSVDEIDRLNIRGATLEGMRRALSGLAIRPEFALIDGRDVPSKLPCPANAIIGGDAKSVTIGAASILAKVMRDRLMKSLDAEAPAYGFARHVGYGVAAHRAAMASHGRCIHHRRSFRVAGVD